MDYATIKRRKSVRTFDPKKIEDAKIQKLKNYIDDVENPFHVPVELELLDGQKNHLSSPVVIGTDTWIAGKVARVADAELAYGYTFEKAVLFATDLGLGTVWLAATIDRQAFEKAMHLTSEEVMPAVSPIGYAAEKRSVRESLMRKGMKSDNRKAFSQIFFKDDFNHPISGEEAEEWKIPLECVRWSPSATNKQPWRIVISSDGKSVYFYEKHTKGYAKKTTGDIQKVDLGIAICHFEIAAKEKGLNGSFLKEDPGLDHSADEEYILTYRTGGTL